MRRAYVGSHTTHLATSGGKKVMNRHGVAVGVEDADSGCASCGGAVGVGFGVARAVCAAGTRRAGGAGVRCGTGVRRSSALTRLPRLHGEVRLVRCSPRLRALCASGLLTRLLVGVFLRLRELATRPIVVFSLCWSPEA